MKKLLLMVFVTGGVLGAQRPVVDDASKKAAEVLVRLHDEKMACLGELVHGYKYKEIESFDTETITVEDVDCLIKDITKKMSTWKRVIAHNASFIGMFLIPGASIAFLKPYLNDEVLFATCLVSSVGPGYFFVKMAIANRLMKNTISSLENLKKRIIR